MNQTETIQKLKMRLSNQDWRLNNLYWITDADGRKVKFHLNWVQRQLFKNLWYLNIILKSRQLGITTLICIYFLDICLFASNIRAGIIAHNREDAEAFFGDKIKFAYDNLPESIKAARIADTSNSRELAFNNNSVIRVGTSLRSSTLQYLHISEFGKICKDYPEKAREIVTGSFNTVKVGQHIFIESTAEGKEGKFYTYCQKAMAKINKKISKLEFKFHFFAWWQDPKNTIEPEGVMISSEIRDYIRTLQQRLPAFEGDIWQKIELSAGQQAWYALKWLQMGEDMKKEHPSFPDEAFESAMEGSYYLTQMRKIEGENRICRLPLESGFPVDTWWDLGMDDSMSIWFTQSIGREIRVIDYYENSGEGLAFYADVLNSKRYSYGKHTAPHDIAVRELGTGKSRLEVAESLGIKFDVAPKLLIHDGIQAVRKILDFCWFDEEKCYKGINGLKDYRKEWNDKLGCYRDRPLHNAASHACLVGSSLIVTKKGIKRIDKIVVGDEVWTPCGYCKVIKAGMTKIVDSLLEIKTDKGMLRCTPEHKIFTNKGVVCANTLRYNDFIWTQDINQTKLFSGESFINFREDIMLLHQAEGKNVATCTGLFGRRVMEQFRKVFTFTIKIAIASIIELRIWNVCRNSTTYRKLQKRVSGWGQRQTNNNLLKLLFHFLRNGIGQKLEENGIASMGKRHGKKENGKQLFALSVEKQKALHILQEQNTAVQVVKVEHVISKNTPVYDLTVDKHHCYIANGLLVSNSDAFRTLAVGHVFSDNGQSLDERYTRRQNSYDSDYNVLDYK